MADWAPTAYFQGINDVFPIFDQQMFNTRLDQMYRSRSRDDVAQYACVNIVFALGSLLHTSGEERRADPEALASRISNAQSWRLFHNTSSHLMDLMMKPSLTSLQALIAMVSCVPELA